MSDQSKSAAPYLFLLSLLLSIVPSEPVMAQADLVPAVVDTMLNLDGARLHFRLIEGGHPTIVMEAGGGSDLGGWKEIPMTLARETGATIVSYSRGGFGESDIPDAPCRMDVESAWLWEGLQQLGLAHDLILVGVSYGGWMIRLEASEHPEAILGIVFVDPFSNEFVEALGVEYLDNHPMTGVLTADSFGTAELNKTQLALVRMTEGGLRHKLELMRETTIPGDIPISIIRSGLPTLPEAHEQEAWDDALIRMAGSIKGADLVVAEDSNHMIHWNRPDLVVEEVVKVVENVRR